MTEKEISRVSPHLGLSALVPFCGISSLSFLSSSKLHLSSRTQHKYHFLHKACLYPLNLLMTSTFLDLQSVLFLSISETYAILPLLKPSDISLNFATDI